MSTSTAVSGVSSEEGKGVEIKKEEVATATATVTEVKKEEVAAAVAAAAVEDEGECDCEECQGGIVEYEEEGGWIGELGVDEHDFY
jgi:hypothetical protein